MLGFFIDKKKNSKNIKNSYENVTTLKIKTKSENAIYSTIKQIPYFIATIDPKLKH